MTQENQKTKIAIAIMNVILQETPETEKTKEYVSELFERCLYYANREITGKFDDRDLS